MKAFTHFFTSEWYFAWPMLLMSLSGVALVIWRMLLNMNANTKMDEFLPLFQKKLDTEGIDGALRLCRSRTDVIPRRLYVSGLQTSKQGTAAMRRAMANEIELEIIPDLNFLLPTILAIAKIATMVGLFGTVISMIGTFTKIAESTDAKAHSASIGLALFATALGLITAIPLVFTHVLFKAWIAQFEVRMKSGAQKLVLLLQNVKPGTDKAGDKTKAGGAAAGGAAPTGKMTVDPAGVAQRR
jgi:biopolymer transport protein ExbB